MLHSHTFELSNLRITDTQPYNLVAYARTCVFLPL